MVFPEWDLFMVINRQDKLNCRTKQIQGDLISIQVELQLKEYAGKIPEVEEEEKGLKRKQ